jgi:RNA polymerase sigma-70 factor (ECF subfamily)
VSIHQTTFESYRSLPTVDSLEALLRAFSDTVYNICYQVLRHPQDAEDASQKVFIEVVRRIGNMNDAEHFKRSLFRISFHVALNQKNADRTRLRHERKRACREESPSQPPVTSEHLSAVHEHVAKLDGESQALIVDYYFGGKKLEELAGAWGCSIVAVWKKLEKAKDRLRKSLIGAGLAGMSALVEPTLEAMSFVPAPKDLLSRDLVARALVVGKPGAFGALLVLGAGMSKNYLLMTVALGLFVAAAAGVQVARRSASPAELSGSSAGSGRTRLHGFPGAEVTAVQVTASPLPPRPRFTSTAFFQAEFQKAVHLVSARERSTALRRLGFDLSEEDFLAVAKDCHAKSGGYRFAREFAAALLTRWAKTNPRAAASLFRDLPQDEEEAHPIDQVCSGKTGLEFPRVYRYYRLRDVIVEWSKHDPEAAAQFVGSVPQDDRESLLHCLQAQSDPAGLAQTVLSLEENERALAVKALADAWGEKDPKEALRWGERLPAPTELATRESFLDAQLRTDFLGAAVRKWARSNLKESLSWVLASPERRWLILPFVEEIAGSDPKGAAAIVDRHLAPDPSDDRYLFDSALGQIAYLNPDPEAAAEMLLAHQPGSPSGLSFETLRHFVQSWAQEDDADLAMRWAMERLDPKLRSWLVIAAAVGRATSTDPDVVGAMAALKTLPEDIRRRGADDILSAYAREHPSEAAALAQSYQAPIPVMEIAEELARQDLEGALTWARSVPDPATRDKAFCYLATGPLGLCWQGQDVPRAIALAAEIRDPSIRLHTQGEIASFWAGRSDPGLVLDWVLSLPGVTLPPSRDTADWIYHTHNSRKEIFDSVVSTWEKQDDKREAARRWIEQCPLPEDSKQALLRSLQGRKK